MEQKVSTRVSILGLSLWTAALFTFGYAIARASAGGEFRYVVLTGTAVVVLLIREALA